jgi:hypothetical protein
MKILFTNTIFFQQKKGGVSRYFINLANELALLKKNFKIIAPLNKNIYLKNFIKVTTVSIKETYAVYYNIWFNFFKIKEKFSFTIII